jgi:dolichol-phosphate mannosyltransferase
MSSRRRFALRWLQFNTVGGIGIGVQLTALTVLKSLLGLHYQLATGIAVEIAILHNFLWHERWTWRDRPAGLRESLRRLLRFNLTTGGLSLFSNLVLMRVLVGAFGLHYLLANLLAIAATSIANFLVSEFFVFRSALKR